MKELLEDMLYILNRLPNRKVSGKDWTTYELAKRIETTLLTQKELIEDFDIVQSKEPIPESYTIKFK